MVKHWRVLGIVGAIALGLTALGRSTSSYQSLDQSLDSRSQGQTQSTAQSFNFLVMGGGGDPSYNEIALEKNVLYFQRTLSVLGFDPASASLFFANGNDGQATVRYLNHWGRERFKPPEIPGLEGASTRRNLSQWVANQSTDCPTFFYFTGHGSLNRRNADDNALLLGAIEQ
ncbi:MAG: Caspase domain-containing protein, partial [Cyanobacteria bacterium J06635_15]